jgi:hypothetical protein
MTQTTDRRARGRGAAVAKSVGETKHQHFSQPRHRPQYAVSNGRTAAGTVRPQGKTRWQAIAPDGTDIGTFKSLREAVAALPLKEGSHEKT